MRLRNCVIGTTASTIPCFPHTSERVRVWSNGRANPALQGTLRLSAARPLNLNVGPLNSLISRALSLSSSALCFSRRLRLSRSISSSVLPSPSCSSASSFFFGLRYAPGLMSDLRSLSSASALARLPAAARCPSQLLRAPDALPGASSASSSAASISRLRFPRCYRATSPLCASRASALSLLHRLAGLLRFAGLRASHPPLLWLLPPP